MRLRVCFGRFYGVGIVATDCHRHTYKLACGISDLSTVHSA